MDARDWIELAVSVAQPQTVMTAALTGIAGWAMRRVTVACKHWTAQIERGITALEKLTDKLDSVQQLLYGLDRRRDTGNGIENPRSDQRGRIAR